MLLFAVKVAEAELAQVFAILWLAFFVLFIKYLDFVKEESQVYWFVYVKFRTFISFLISGHYELKFVQWDIKFRGFLDFSLVAEILSRKYVEY